ncbi:pyruvate dehydrogenase complex dihydrolipoamide acetyltransferase [Fibrella sp. HMF5335]|uniref:Acetyltransferase component of pyruvate dehydrogenase complex n=1 Tax=Fibrella rubiginis TaxID=2817060 RepID=A0A939GA29_9BACT|nr:pyruvate dehydrogenase complex dihydrolipoamide acetyltransferase [Fibrella rubiginis]MBO0935247.1 pyruvate dehydrogenase complex dihydrolipoamide acetyltransferase [Fibrella rubiginis]
MAELIRMPKMSDTMTEGVIAEWHKKVGDTVKSGDVLAEVETDKATMDLEAYDEGTLLYIGVEKGQAVPIDGVIAVIGQQGEDFQALLNGNTGGSAEVKPTTAPPANSPAPAAADTKQVNTSMRDAEVISAAPAADAGNATVIRMPKMSDTMTEGTIVAWHKKEGDAVKSGDVLAEVETDKATMDLEAYEEGTLLYIGVKEGEAVAVDAVIAVVGEKGANFKVLLDGKGGGDAASSAPAPASAPASGPANESGSASGNDTAEQNPQADVPANAATDLSYAGASENGHDANGRLKASPLAKAIADQKGIDLKQIHGTGPEGRIVKADVESFNPQTAPQAKPAAPAQPAAPAPAAPAPQPAQSAPAPAIPPVQPTPVAAGDYEDIPLTQMRKTIARRLSESLFTAPHFYLTMEITMDKAMALRGQVNAASPVKISFNDFVIKAAALALKQHPNVNSSWLGDKIRKYNYVNIGVAVAVDEGLLVPVVRNADHKTLSTIAGEVKEMAGKAKDKKLQPKDWEGSTFSISNLGMFGIDQFTAIINPPDACILAVGAIKQSVAFEGEIPKPVNIMKVTLSCDHRVVDGATGAAFLQTFKGFLEDPMKMLV